jgi:phenylalanyl-tRNA synthetase beta chain
VSHAAGQAPVRAPVRVRPSRARTLLGYPVADAEMAAILKRLACAVEGSGEGMRATAPSWRFDLEIEEDFVEEVARIHGYEHVPDVAPRSSLPMTRLTEGERDRFDLRHALADLGYQEVVNYSFVPEESERDFAGNTRPVRLANPIASHMAVMRPSLLGGLVQSLTSNLNRGESRARLFEIGRCFEGDEPSLQVQPERIAGLAYGSRRPEQWGEKGERGDFFDAKGDVETLCGGIELEFTPGSHPAFHPGRCAEIRHGGRPIGVVGELHPRLAQKHELDAPPVAFELLTGPLLEGSAPRFGVLSRMPIVRRDLALVVAENVPAGALVAAARARVPAFVREIEVFDQYRGKGVEAGKKSLALRIVMQDTDRTLTDSDVEGVVASIREQLNEQFQAKPRT